MKSVEASSECVEVLPGRWLETAHTYQCDEDLHPAEEKEELVFVRTGVCWYNMWPSYTFVFNLFTLYSTLCPCQCTVCMSTSLPIAIKYQYTLSPTSMFKPFTFPYINPLMPEEDTNTHTHTLEWHFEDAPLDAVHFVCIFISLCILLLSMKVSSSFKFVRGLLMWVLIFSSRYLEEGKQ